MSQIVVQPGTYPVTAQPAGFVTNQVNSSCCGRVIEKIFGKTLKGLGSVQIVIGILCIVCNIIGLTEGPDVLIVGHGIWCGIIFIIAGGFGVAAGYAKRSGYVVTCMTMSIISAVATVPLFSLGAVGWSINANDYDYDYEFNDYSHTYEARNKVQIVMNAFLVVLGLLEGIIAIVTACFCCHAICCCGHTGIVHGAPGQFGQQQVLVIQGNTGVQQTVQTSVPFMSNPQGYGQPVPGYQPQATQMAAPPEYSSKDPAVVDNQGPPPYNPQYPAAEHGGKI